MTDKCKCSVFKKTSYFSRKIARTKCPLTCSASSCSRATLSTRTYSRPVCWCQAHQDSSLPALPTSGTPSSWLSTSPESSCQPPWEQLMMVWLCLEDWKGKIREKAKWKFNVKMFTLLDVKMIQICTFPAALSTEPCRASSLFKILD